MFPHAKVLILDIAVSQKRSGLVTLRLPWKKPTPRVGMILLPCPVAVWSWSRWVCLPKNLSRPSFPYRFSGEVPGYPFHLKKTFLEWSTWEWCSPHHVKTQNTAEKINPATVVSASPAPKSTSPTSLSPLFRCHNLSQNIKFMKKSSIHHTLCCWNTSFTPTYPLCLGVWSPSTVGNRGAATGRTGPAAGMARVCCVQGSAFSVDLCHLKFGRCVAWTKSKSSKSKWDQSCIANLGYPAGRCKKYLL